MNTKKVTLVTGAASGIGRATASKLAERGDQLVCTDFASAQLQEVKDLTNGICLGADVTIESEVEALVAATIAEYGRLDGVVQNLYHESHHDSKAQRRDKCQYHNQFFVGLRRRVRRNGAVGEACNGRVKVAGDFSFFGAGKEGVVDTAVGFNFACQLTIGALFGRKCLVI